MEEFTADKKTDRRIHRTKRMLKEALFALILEKGYDGVTVEDITQKADLGRTTFYLHYRDKEDLLLKSIDAIADDLIGQISHTNLFSGEVDPIISFIEMQKLNPVSLVFQHAAENASLYQIILRGGSATTAAGRFREIIRTAAKAFFGVHLKQTGSVNQPEIPLDVLANYYAGSLLSLVTWWLENGMPYPPEQMASIFRQLFFQGAQSVVNTQET
jgi:AcrR family transcriptional regulator